MANKININKADKAGGKDKKTKGNKSPEKKKINLKAVFNQNTFLGITLVGLIVLVLQYVFIYMDYTQKTEELTASNAEIRKEIEELQVYADNIETYKSEINDMKTVIENTVAEYPADAREEDVIMLAVQIQEKNAIAYNSINMEETEGVYTVPYDNVKLAEIEEMDRDLVFARKHATYASVTNYDNMKSCIKQIFDSSNRIGIGSIVYVKNEEDGTLEGSMDLYFYSAAGTGKEYVVPDISQYLSGTSDLFRSDKVVGTNEPVDGEADENAEGSVETE